MSQWYTSTHNFAAESLKPSPVGRAWGHGFSTVTQSVLSREVVTPPPSPSQKKRKKCRAPFLRDKSDFTCVLQSHFLCLWHLYHSLGLGAPWDCSLQQQQKPRMYFLNAVLFFSQATSYDIRCVYLQQLSLWHQPNWAATQHPPVDGGCSQTFLLPKVLLQNCEFPLSSETL